MKRRGLLRLVVATTSLKLASASAWLEQAHSGVRTSLGPPDAPHAMPGGDARRSRRAPSRLSSSPRVERRLRVALGIGRGLVTRADGSSFVLHPNARASCLDAQGKLLYSLKLPAEAGSAPVVTSSGSVAFLCAGELLLTDERGQLRAHTPFGEPDSSARSILATRDGGVLLASSGLWLKSSAFGELVFRRSASESTLELLETSLGELAVSTTGSLFRLDAAGRSSKLGELGGSASAVTASADGATLLVRSGAHRLLFFDLHQRRVRASVEEAALELDGPVLLSRDGVAQVFSSDGLLVRYRPDGSELQRIPVDPGARKAPAADDALLLSDGRLLLARVGADVAVVSPSGEPSFIAGSACPDPIGLFASGPGSVLLACRSGTLLRLA